MRPIVVAGIFFVTGQVAVASDCASKLDAKTVHTADIVACLNSLEMEINKLAASTVRGVDAGNALGVDFHNTSGGAKIVMVSGVNTVEGGYTMHASISPDDKGVPNSWSDAAAASFSAKNFVSSMTFVVPNNYHYKVLSDYKGSNQDEIKLVLWTETSY